MKVKEVIDGLRMIPWGDALIMAESLPDGERKIMYVSNIWHKTFMHLPGIPFFTTASEAIKELTWNLTDEEANAEAYAAVASRRQDVDKPYQIIVRYRVVSMDGCVMECEMINE